MSTQFSAGPQALGYLYQLIPYALYVILDQLGKQDRYLRLEKFDDIEICAGDTPYESIQVKQTNTNLSNRSTDLWKTMRVWSENVTAGKLKLSDTILTLATTAKAPEHSIASFLRPGPSRQTDRALTMLLRETERTTSSLEQAFSAFTALTSQQQRNLVGAIHILDSAPDIEEIVEKIKNKLVGVHMEHRVQLYSELQGWWFSKVVEHLRSGSEILISMSSVWTKIAELNDRFKGKKLQDPFLDEPLPSNYDWDNRTFVLQLRMIDLPLALEQMAKRDFYRASRLRDWLVEELYIKELTAYDQRLKDEWQLCFYDSIRQSDLATCDEDAQKRVGQSIYMKVQKEVDIPIHQDLTDQRITRGSYQVLADAAEVPDVGWHPFFKEALCKLLKDRK